MKLPRKTFEFVDSSLITYSPTRLRMEFYISFASVCILLASFVFWNSPGWMFYADIAYLQLVLGLVLIVVAMTFLWIVLTLEKVVVKKIRIKKYKIEVIASFVTLPFEFFVVYVILDFIEYFRPISSILQGITAAFIIVALLLLSLWAAFSLERWHSVRKSLSDEDEQISVEEWVEEYEKIDEPEDEDEYVKEREFEEIDYSS